MRIAHVIRSDAFAGAERYVCTAAARQDRVGHEVIVIGGDGARMRTALAHTGVAWQPASTVLAAVRRLATIGRSDIVHAHMTAAELASVVSAFRAKIVTTRHFAACRGSSATGRAAARLIESRIHAQIAISDYVARSVEGSSVVVHPGTPDVEHWVPAAGRKPVVLVAQRLEAEKRTDVAVRVWAASGLADAGWTMQIAGSGALRQPLQTLARDLGVDRSCQFLGARSDVDGLLLTAGVLVAPRHDEPYGLSVVEAMAAGLPVAGGAGGGHDETVGASRHAVLIPEGDIEAGGEMLRLLALDEQLRDDYGLDLRRLQRERFSAAQQVDAVTAVYRGLVSP